MKGAVYALNPDGSLKWSFKTDEVYSPLAIGADGTIYFGGWFDEKVYALNSDGTLRWSFKTGRGIAASPVIGADGTVYVGSTDKKLYALNPDGSVKWSFNTGHMIQFAPAIAADGTIYVVGRGGTMHVINPDGTLKWLFKTGGDIWSAPIMAADGTVYIGSDDGKLYALHEENGGLADSPWPMFQQNPQLTGRQLSETTLAAASLKYADSFDYPLRDDNPNDNLKWSVVQGFGDLYAEMGGYHSGEDWNLVGGRPDADLGKLVYAVANGQIKKVSYLGGLGYLVAIEHHATLGGTFTIPAKYGQSYSYLAEEVATIISVYMHVLVDESKISEGAWIEKGYSETLWLQG